MNFCVTASAGRQVGIPSLHPQQHMDLPYAEQPPSGQHPFFIATQGQQSFEKSYGIQPSNGQRPFANAPPPQQFVSAQAPQQFANVPPTQQGTHLETHNVGQPTRPQLQAPSPSQQLANLNLTMEQVPEHSHVQPPPQQASWSPSCAGTYSAGNQFLQSQPSATLSQAYSDAGGLLHSGTHQFQTPQTQQSQPQIHHSLGRFNPMASSRPEHVATNSDNVKVMDTLAKMVREFTKHQETQNVLISKLVAIEVKIDSMQQLGGANNYVEEEGSELSLLPLGELAAIKPFEESLADKDKYYKLVDVNSIKVKTPIFYLFCFVGCIDSWYWRVVVI